MRKYAMTFSWHKLYHNGIDREEKTQKHDQLEEEVPLVTDIDVAKNWFDIFFTTNIVIEGNTVTSMMEDIKLGHFSLSIKCPLIHLEKVHYRRTAVPHTIDP